MVIKMSDEKSYGSMEELTKRVNELYHKSQDTGLTEDEKKEQDELRKAYVANVRKNVLALRDAMAPAVRAEKSSRIIKTLLSTEAYRSANVILTYVNYQSEVITTALIEHSLADKKLVFAPKVAGDDMDFYRIGGISCLKEGYRGILEPSGDEIFNEKIFCENSGNTLVIMPGAVFDEKRHRIGDGKGFYDRYLLRMEELGITIHTVALCFECQMLQNIPYGIHDRKPDFVLTEKRLIGVKENTHE